MVGLLDVLDSYGGVLILKSQCLTNRITVHELILTHQYALLVQLPTNIKMFRLHEGASTII